MGNGNLITHGVTGLLFSSPLEFIQHAKELLTNTELSKSMTRNAREFVSNRFSSEVERNSYQALVQAAMTTAFSSVQSTAKI